MEEMKGYGKQRKESIWTDVEEKCNLMKGNAVEVKKRGSEGQLVGNGRSDIGGKKRRGYDKV